MFSFIHTTRNNIIFFFCSTYNLIGRHTHTHRHIETDTSAGMITGTENAYDILGLCNEFVLDRDIEARYQELTTQQEQQQVDDPMLTRFRLARDQLLDPFRRWIHDNTKATDTTLLLTKMRLAYGDILVSLEDVYSGVVERNIQHVCLSLQCSICSGLGFQLLGECGKCMGVGNVGYKVEGERGIQTRLCDICNGQKKLIDRNHPCKKCYTSGKLKVVAKSTLTLVPGMWAPSRFLLQGTVCLSKPRLAEPLLPKRRRGQGGALWKSLVQSRRQRLRHMCLMHERCLREMDPETLQFTTHTCVIMTYNVRTHPTFEWVQKEGHLYLKKEVSVSLAEMLFGFQRLVPSLTGEPILIHSPLRFQPSAKCQIRIPGHGMRRYGSLTQRGDLVVTVSVMWPVPRIIAQYRDLATPIGVKSAQVLLDLLGSREVASDLTDLTDLTDLQQPIIAQPLIECSEKNIETEVNPDMSETESYEEMISRLFQPLNIGNSITPA